MSSPVHITMLGTFSLTVGDVRIDDRSNRMRKIWLLLAYLIYNRSSRPTQEQFLSLLGGSDGESEDPSGRLKALFYRARTMLDPISKAIGCPLIVHQQGTYRFSPDVAITLDIDEFDALRKNAASLPENARLESLLKATALYQGDFLPKLSMENWTMPINAYYHQRYLETVLEALTLLQQQNRFTEGAALCRQALVVEPYSEELYQHLMQCLIATDKCTMAVSAYETMSELLFSTFGVMPSDESRNLYREATKEKRETSTPSETIHSHLQEPVGASGAVFCEYDFFKLLYQVQARSLVRNGDTVHIAFLSLHGENDKALSRRSLDCAMDNLKNLVVSSLRQGDVVTRYSASQLIIMLPQANFENSCMVCKRIVRNFCRQYPHSPAQLRYSVHPLEPLATIK